MRDDDESDSKDPDGDTAADLPGAFDLLVDVLMIEAEPLDDAALRARLARRNDTASRACVLLGVAPERAARLAPSEADGATLPLTRAEEGARLAAGQLLWAPPGVAVRATGGRLRLVADPAPGAATGPAERRAATDADGTGEPTPAPVARPAPEDHAGTAISEAEIARIRAELRHIRVVLSNRVAQHGFVARLGTLSLEGMEAAALTAEIPGGLAHVLGVDFAKVLRCRPGTDAVELVASHGLDVPLGTLIDGGPKSQAGYTLMSGMPVLVRDLPTDDRFDGPPLLRQAGVISGLSVIIGDPRNPMGVIGVHSRTPRDFTRDDQVFLQSVANILAAALRREADDRQKRLLLDELRHRVKNMLATVQSVTALSLRHSGVAGAVAATLGDRLRALARAHDLNFRRSDDYVDMRELVRLQVDPYDPDGARVSFEGPETASMPPNIAIEMSMLVHELVTNAVKYGALSTESGHVIIRSGASHGAHGWRLSLDWHEVGGPGFAEPPHVGAGTRLLQAIAAQPAFDMDYAPHAGGLDCRITVDLSGA
ncbi:GAF domain-containing protein [Mesobaculum littorinae]|uniref:histidine kinase n=1 Tax=Mesobaculum littorinae TaxID=2486419 RepID=A0A438AL83_9RHOB|nr:HWE histidine kinase domain-containing protein [Mesobaculum littorinae]RVV99336.1 GAF domain-containing protein [Mesobaculum littorinae]